MKKISLSSFNIKPIISSAYHLDISDEEYFGPNYRNFISNSKLKLINPDQGGTPKSYKNGRYCIIAFRKCYSWIIFTKWII